VKNARRQLGVGAWKRGSVEAWSQSRTSTHLRIYASALLLFLGGCGIGSERKAPAQMEVEKLQQEKAALTSEVQQHQAEITQLQAQIRSLSVLPKDQSSNPYELTAVRIARISNFFDKDSDGKQEKLVVYVQPIDAEGDVVKAAGTAAVQLWNLDNPNGEALLGQWQVEPAELRKLWFDSFTTGYRLTFDRPEGLEVLSKPLTVKVTFTDYLTGKTLRAQQVIEPKVD